MTYAKRGTAESTPRAEPAAGPAPGACRPSPDSAQRTTDSAQRATDNPYLGLQRRRIDGLRSGPDRPADGTDTASAPTAQGALPAQLRAGLEALGGVPLSDVRVHYNSARPAQLQAQAFAQGRDIHLAPGAEQHLPHEAWHTVQQRQGRVRPTGRAGGVPVNADPGLEREADVMGARALSAQPHGKAPAGTRATQRAAATVQRVAEVTIGGVLSEDSVLNASIRGREPDFKGEMWFHDLAEAEAYADGTAEGMGLWGNEWINLAGPGTIVFGEEHNAIREELVRSLRIRHRLVEGAFERSLQGVDPQHIAAAPQGYEAHAKYDGGTEFKALENYWLRGGQYMERFAAPVLERLSLAAELSRQAALGDQAPPDVWLPPLERPSELQELIRTLKASTIPVLDAQTSTPDQRQMVAALATAQHYAERCADFGLEDFIRVSAKDGRGGKMAQFEFWSHYQGQTRALSLLHRSFALLAESVEALGYQQFRASASPLELQSDAVRVQAARTKKQQGEELTGFEVWSARREVAMLANLRDAMAHQPPPLLVTLGAAHARNRKQAIEGMAGVRALVIGDIGMLAALGRKT